MSEKCRSCRGCGKLANTADAEPWSMWEDLPVKSAAAVLLGWVKPVTCPACNGSGLKKPELWTQVWPGAEPLEALQALLFDLDDKIAMLEGLVNDRKRVNREFALQQLIEGFGNIRDAVDGMVAAASRGEVEDPAS